MLLVQKPLTLTPSQSPLYAHRRHPSAPSTVVVHSTPTPGLLTLSKPPRPPLQRQNQRQTPKPLPNSKSTPAIRATLLNSAEITDSKTSEVIALPTTPSPPPRGRGQIIRATLLNSAEIMDSKTSGVIALPTTPSPPPRGRGQIKHPKDKVQVQRKHRRAPSDGVFHMSSDEDLSSGPGGTLLNPNVQALFGLVNTFDPSSSVPPSLFSTPIRSIPPYRRDSASPSNGSLPKEKLSEGEAAEKAAGYFASSIFQNSPGPEELPDPLLF